MTAERLLINADIRTMDPGLPRIDAILLRGEKVVALAEDAKAASVLGVDMHDRLILPGFQDAHGRLRKDGADLVETAQLYEMTALAGLQTVLTAHTALWPGEMVWGAGTQNGFFSDETQTKAVRDAVVLDRSGLIYDGRTLSCSTVTSLPVMLTPLPKLRCG